MKVIGKRFDVFFKGICKMFLFKILYDYDEKVLYILGR